MLRVKLDKMSELAGLCPEIGPYWHFELNHQIAEGFFFTNIGIW